MKHNNEIVVLALIFLLGSAAGNAGAATRHGGYLTDAAVIDTGVYAGTGGHALWFAGDSNDYMFSQGAGTLIEYDDGTAVFTGTVYGDLDPLRGYEITLYLNGRTNVGPDGSPKRELMDSAYIENGGTVDTGSWYYYTGFSGTLLGVGDLAGTVLSISQRGPAFQVGAGANGKNANFGASAWFLAADGDGEALSGDFNLNLQPVPVPAALPLLFSALGALGLLARGRRNR